MVARIAVVNDDSDFLDLMHDLLESEGYEVSVHRVAHHAYAELTKIDLDLIILDIRMETPEAGWQLLELLRLDRAMAAIPVIVCSADAPFLRAKEAHLQARGCATLEKPFTLDDLLGHVATALNRS